MIKERFDVVASSLGSYFGVGFNTPLQQMAYDLGLEEPVFDDASQDRMDLGIYLENAVLDYFENKLKIKITDRNDKILWAFDNKLKCKVDGMTVYNGEQTIVECKVSNAQGYKFTDDKGYYLQCQAYMQASGYTQCLLLGLWQGKPIYRLIRRDEKVIALIEQVVDFLFDCFSGLADPAEFPYEVTQQYNEQVILDDAVFDKDDVLLASELFFLKQKAKEDIERMNELETYFKGKFKNVKYEGDEFNLTVSIGTRAGGLDLDRLQMSYPDIAFDDFKKPDSEYTTLRLTPRKKPK